MVSSIPQACKVQKYRLVTLTRRISSEQPGLLGTSWFALFACTAKFGDRQDHHLPTNVKRVQAFYSNAWLAAEQGQHLFLAPDPERSPLGRLSQVSLPQVRNHQSPVRSV